MDSLLVRLLGWPATLIHGDTLVLDRWLWLKRQLPKAGPGMNRLLDVGCGSGAFTIGLARHGYRALGLSWDERNQKIAEERARLCKTAHAAFEVQDVRQLDRRSDFRGQFDVIICCENIEHILDDLKLMKDMAACLRPGGLLFLTTPSSDYRPITRSDLGPFSTIEDGGHVRKGYCANDLRDLCAQSNFEVQRIGYVSGFSSQKLTALMRVAARVHPVLGWLIVLPLRIFPPLFDPLASALAHWPGFSITLVAVKT
ncbi:MAG: class I SAM-dependent methyltransferase [Rhizomicrobium sp.]